VLAPILGCNIALYAMCWAIVAAALLSARRSCRFSACIGAALTLGTRGAASLLALADPAPFVPVLIFGAAQAGCGVAGWCRVSTQSVACSRGVADHALVGTAFAMARRAHRLD
jgi:ABC-type transport system involved in cytochrome c biogenesis permease component